jgi:serine/threonine protein kinase
MHGDLKPQNVLLKTAAADRRGYVCKLADFGLSRMLQETETHVNTGSYGTVTHAAPELLSEGRLTKSSDVFAFGMLLWELVTGQRLFRDMHHMQVGAGSERAQCCGCSAAHPL